MSASSRKVLVVDDNENDVFLITRALRLCGVEQVVSVRSAEDAIKVVTGQPLFENATKPDIIFTDFHMQEIDGLELVKWLKNDPLFSCIPIVVMSGSQDPVQRAALQVAAPEAILEKPNKFEDMIELVRQLLKDRFPDDF